MVRRLVDISCTKTDELNYLKWFSTDHDIKISDLVYSWDKMGCLVTAASRAWLMKLYPAKMALFVK